MSVWPELRESRTVRAGRAPGNVIRCGVIRCGLMDTMLADIPVSVVFFYQRAPDIAHLADGLAMALDLVPVFAGRLREGGERLEIVCEDAGVPMNVYDVDETLGEAISRVVLPGAGFVDHIEAPAARAGGLPLLTVRISMLSDGGMAMGCSWHHAVGDMQSFMLLMRVWSACVKGVEPPAVRIVDNMDEFLEDRLPAKDSGRPGFRLPDDAKAAELNNELMSAVRANRAVQVYFSESEISRMRAEVTAAAAQRLSTNDVLCGHVVSTIRRLDEDLEARSMAIPINIRRYIDLPPEVIGNLVNEVYVACSPKGTAEGTAAEIRAAVNEYGPESLNIRANHAFLRSVGHDRLRDCLPIGFDPAIRTFTVTNWSRFGVYDIVFDGHAPTFFSPATNMVLPWVAWVVEGFDRTGFLFMVALPAKLAARLRSADGRAALHVYRDPDEELPTLVQAVKKMI
ncbi:MAG TPA: acyltransferase [Pseudonocardiaceae bacterium]|nr:acyltransferase [Pseudonocardiaceae bacterium]